MSARIGVAAFALGISVLGPQVGIACADNSTDSASSSSTATARSQAPSARTATTARASAAASRRSNSSPKASAAVSTARVARSTKASAADSVVPAALRRASAPAADSVANLAIPASSAVSSPAVTANAEEPIEGGKERKGKAEAEKPSVVQKIDAGIYGVLDNISGRLADLPVNGFTELLNGGFLLVRRTLFDQAPTVTPQQTTGQQSGAITGTAGAVDPENDPLYYKVVIDPQDGTATINPDGTFAYTPGQNFSGRDVFVVSVSDRKSPLKVALWGNIIQPFRPTSTQGLVIVEQGDTNQITYNFVYFQTRYGIGLDVGRWTPNGKISTQWAAYALADEVTPAKDITLTYTATALKDRRSGTLASANSNLTNEKDPGFYPTVVQSRIQTGSDPVVVNGQPVADGLVNVNFGAKWSYSGAPGRKQFDLPSVMMHEFIHSYGFLSTILNAACNVSTCDDKGNPTPAPRDKNWSTYDQFISNKQGVDVIDPETYTWRTAYNDNLTGGNDGLYFWGLNTNEAFGGPVPVFTPEKFRPGSSMSHLNDAYFNNKTDPNSKQYIQLMNADDAPGQQTPRYLSKNEIGIFKDLGYTMATPI